MNPLPSPSVPGNTEWERFDNAVKKVFSVSPDAIRREGSGESDTREEEACERREYPPAISMDFRTWSGAKRFRYQGSVLSGLTIQCGKEFSREYRLSAEAISDTLTHFSGRVVEVGCHRTNPPSGSIGAWLRTKHQRAGIMSYFGPILIEEGRADRSMDGKISIRKFPSS